jgi:phage shock protein A
VVGNDQESAINRMKSKVHVSTAENAAATEVLTPESLEDRFRTLESQDQVELMLKEIKSRQSA